ncbi:MAG: hypothetical protein WD768_00560 [Phycisphaeraceae bacterium]
MGIQLVEKRVMRFELTTFTLANCEHRLEASQLQPLTEAPADACTAACTDKPEIEHGESFADVVRMLDRLPLTDAERAEAVRRLLAGDAAKGGTR